MEKEKKRPKTFKTIAIRITALVLGVWLLSMLFLTWAVANDFYKQLDTQAQLISRDYHVHYGSSFDESLPGYDDMIRMQRLGEAYYLLRTENLMPFVLPQTPDMYSSDDWFYGHWELLYGFQPAVIFYDQDRNVLMKSGNILSFSYCTDANWHAQTPEVNGIGWIDIDALPEGQERWKGYLWGGADADAPSNVYLWGWSVLRLTGYFEGSQFHPTSLDQGITSDFDMLEPEQFAQRDGAGQMKWENVFSLAAPPDQELTTLYSWQVGGYLYDHQGIISGGRYFDSLVDLLHTDLVEDGWYHRESLLDGIIIYRGRTVEDDPEVGTYALAIRCWPMAYAALRLIPTYLVSFALVALALWLLLRSIKRNVTNTLEMLVHRTTTDAPIEHLSGWQELHALEAILKDERERRRSLLNDNGQLQKSLEYAKNAEENRRQLVSNITHELKTPLAIIHSYAEGLQSGIAEEKKERYLATILEEAERMDATVLEMLDHSRLESGKVKLAADHFSLLKLTEDIAEKLAPAMEERQLTLSWGFTNACMLTADESRMGQVVTNLLTNAIRYTPEGGTIHLRVFSDAKDATFQIENEAEHLPPEVLEKIFETFYRADESRTVKGTGLGLPIAKSIVELHRGTIKAMNTYINRHSCVQFSFSIPLK